MAIEKESLNGFLFHGIVQMEWGLLIQDESLLQKALKDFENGLKKDNYHPSFLRRKAMVLDKINLFRRRFIENSI